MEALAAFGIDWKLLLLQIFNFGVVLLVLRKYLYRPLIAMLDERNAKLKKGVEDAVAAAQAKSETEAARSGILADARKEGEGIVDRMKKDAEARERDMLREADEKRAALIRAAHEKAEEERQHLLNESEKELARIAVLGAERILKQKHS